MGPIVLNAIEVDAGTGRSVLERILESVVVRTAVVDVRAGVDVDATLAVVVCKAAGVEIVACEDCSVGEGTFVTVTTLEVTGSLLDIILVDV